MTTLYIKDEMHQLLEKRYITGRIYDSVRLTQSHHEYNVNNVFGWRIIHFNKMHHDIIAKIQNCGAGTLLVLYTIYWYNGVERVKNMTDYLLHQMTGLGIFPSVLDPENS